VEGSNAANQVSDGLGLSDCMDAVTDILEAKRGEKFVDPASHRCQRIAFERRDKSIAKFWFRPVTGFRPNKY
jgi:hypothetical protein